MKTHVTMSLGKWREKRGTRIRLNLPLKNTCNNVLEQMESRDSDPVGFNANRPNYPAFSNGNTCANEFMQGRKGKKGNWISDHMS